MARQLQRQVLEENLLQKSIVMMQQNSAHFEEGIVRSIQSAWQTFDEWQSRASVASQEIFRNLSLHLASLAPDREWIQFAARSDHLLDPDTPLRDPELISYPLKDDPSVFPVHTGHMERKKRFTRAYTESYFVLTPVGFLHEFSTGDPNSMGGLVPSFSLFLPSCTLGPVSSPRTKNNKFHIEGRKDGMGTTKSKSGSFKGLIGRGDGADGSKSWSFRLRSREEMMEWWNDLKMLCARYLVASEQFERTGPVEAAVKSVGYATEEEEEEEEEEEMEEEEIRREEVEGSSVEEEADYQTYEEDSRNLPPPIPYGATTPPRTVPRFVTKVNSEKMENGVAHANAKMPSHVGGRHLSPPPHLNTEDVDGVEGVTGEGEDNEDEDDDEMYADDDVNQDQLHTAEPVGTETETVPVGEGPTAADVHPQDEQQEGFEHHGITDRDLQQKESTRDVSGDDDTRVETNGGALAHGSMEELQHTA